MANKRLYHFLTLTKNNSRLYFGISILVFLFILFFQPFDIAKFEFENTLIFITGFGLIVFAFAILNQILFHNILIDTETDRPRNALLFPLYYISLHVTTSLAFIFYIQYVGQSQITFNTVVKIGFICAALPATIYVERQFLNYSKRITELKQSNQHLQNKLRKFTESSAKKIIEIKSNNEVDDFRVFLSEIVFVKSADNYVELAYRDGEKIKKTMLRNTLKNVELQLSEYNNFIRTHRSSIINLDFADKLNKKYNKYWLSLHETADIIPVSRQYLMSVKEAL